MRSLNEVRELTTNYLSEKGIDAARREADLLLQDALGLSRLELYTDFERPVTEGELALCRDRLGKRASGMPLAYIHGEVEFLDCTLTVNPAVLIPRQETEILADRIIRDLEGEDLAGKVFWDVCCGSGCLGIAIKKRYPELTVRLLDLSPRAIEVARQNAERNGVEVDCLQGDLLEAVQGSEAHYVVANPPYIPNSDYEDLDPSVRDFEPKMALIGGKLGVEIYQRFSKELRGHLAPQGKLWMELGFDQGGLVKKIFVDAGWRDPIVEPDFAGHDRFFFLANE